MLASVLWLVDTVIQLVIWLVIASAIMSWLVAFNVVNPRNGVVYQIGRFLEAVTEPLLRPIRKIVPLLGGIDVSPIILILLLEFLRRAIVWGAMNGLTGF
ncbi:MAG TPA: YggT family protein [Caulobacteraceae bacterium]|nr:YggT family protein [Caulobacteraceae bacterium]